MKLLLIKTSSMGDILHTLPALSDAKKAYPDITIDWAIEPNFAEIPRLHPAVRRIIATPLRQLRRHPWQAYRQKKWQQLLRELRAEKYDLILDAQGLIKSSLLCLVARGQKCGLNWGSAWEPLATLAYHTRCQVDPNQHAITRMRQLFAAALHYPVPTTAIDYGINPALFPLSYSLELTHPYLVFLHGTTWPTKLWPLAYWQALRAQCTKAGYHIYLPWGNLAEKAQAEAIASNDPNAHILPQLSLTEIAGVLTHAQGVVAVDTGLGHLSAALAIPTISLYGATDATLTGTQGQNQIHIAVQFGCAPCLARQCRYKAQAPVFPACFATVPPDLVWQQLKIAFNPKNS